MNSKFVICRKRIVCCVTVIVFTLFVAFLTIDILSDQLIGSFGCYDSPCSLSSARDSTQRMRDGLSTNDSRVVNGRLFPVSRPLLIMSIDYHESPRQDLINLLEPLGVRFVGKGIDTYACSYFNACRSAGSPMKDLVGIIFVILFVLFVVSFN